MSENDRIYIAESPFGRQGRLTRAQCSDLNQISRYVLVAQKVATVAHLTIDCTVCGHTQTYQAKSLS